MWIHCRSSVCWCCWPNRWKQKPVCWSVCRQFHCGQFSRSVHRKNITSETLPSVSRLPQVPHCLFTVAVVEPNTLSRLTSCGIPDKASRLLLLLLLLAMLTRPEVLWGQKCTLNTHNGTTFDATFAAHHWKAGKTKGKVDCTCQPIFSPISSPLAHATLISWHDQL